jgi:cadmium resistance protein CadD (predicted permease)
MPRSWIPFRGDNYSKENSKRYLPKSISVTTRIFGTIVLVSIAVIFAYSIITNYMESKNGFSLLGLIILGIIIIISILALKDSRKIDTQSRKSSNSNKLSDD